MGDDEQKDEEKPKRGRTKKEKVPPPTLMEAIDSALARQPELDTKEKLRIVGWIVKEVFAAAALLPGRHDEVMQIERGVYRQLIGDRGELIVEYRRALAVAGDAKDREEKMRRLLSTLRVEYEQAARALDDTRADLDALRARVARDELRPRKKK